MGVNHMTLEQRQLSENTNLRLAIDNLVRTASTCDARRASHQIRVTYLCCAMAEKLGLSLSTIKGLSVSASLHDLGLLRVPTDILEKSGELTDDEVRIMRVHPQTGYELLKNVDFPWPVAEIILQHHEHFDGSGYPSGLVGDKIRDEAKIICVADTVEAITAIRPYHPAAHLQQAIDEIERGSGSFYDSDAVDAVLQLIHNGKLIVNGWPELT